MFEILVDVLFLLAGIVALGVGIQQRREDGPADGVVGITIGSVLLSLFCLSIALSFIVSAVKPDAETPTAADEVEALTSQQTQSFVHAADKYLRSIDQVRLTGKADGGFGADLTYVEDEDAVGTITVNRAKIRLIRVGDDTYVNPSDEFWRDNADPQGVIDFVDGRWIRFDPDDKRWGQLAKIAERDILLETLSDRRTYTRGDSRTIHGVECDVVTPNFGGGDLCITESPTRLLHFDDGQGFVGDLDYDAPTVTPKAPSRVVESSEVFPESPTT